MRRPSKHAASAILKHAVPVLSPTIGGNASAGELNYMNGLRTLASLAAAVAFAGVAGAQDITVFVNGEPVRFQGVGAQQMQGRVLVPLRGVMERLGAYVSYLPESKTVIATKGDIDLQLRLGQRLARLNGREVVLD